LAELMVLFTCTMLNSPSLRFREASCSSDIVWRLNHRTFFIITPPFVLKLFFN
jgi:hypothetical protein